MTTRDRNILLVLGTLAVLAAFWFLAIKPKRAEVHALSGQIATQHKRVTTAQATYAARFTMSSSVNFNTTGFIATAFLPSRVPLLKS